jgi:hypothetical protein
MIQIIVINHLKKRDKIMYYSSVNCKLGIIVIFALILSCSKNNTTEPAISNDKQVKANFKIEKTDNIVPVTINFINSSKQAISYEWNFGDGTLSTEENPAHLYENAGSYGVKLVAIGEKGRDSLVQVLELINPPVEIFLDSGAAGIRIGDPLSKAIELHGNDYEEYHSEGTTHDWLIDYITKGIEFHALASDADEQSKLSAIILYICLKAPYKGITDAGIGIGSSRSEVLKKYTGYYVVGTQTYRVGNSYFEFDADKVSGITIIA